MRNVQVPSHFDLMLLDYKLKSPVPNDLDPYIPQYDVSIGLSSKLYWSKLISILFKIRDVVYVQITNISLASRLSCRSRSLTAVTSHWLVSEIRRTLASVIICTSMGFPHFSVYFLHVALKITYTARKAPTSIKCFYIGSRFYVFNHLI